MPTRPLPARAELGDLHQKRGWWYAVARDPAGTRPETSVPLGTRSKAEARGQLARLRALMQSGEWSPWDPSES